MYTIEFVTTSLDHDSFDEAIEKECAKYDGDWEGSGVWLENNSREAAYLFDQDTIEGTEIIAQSIAKSMKAQGFEVTWDIIDHEDEEDD